MRRIVVGIVVVAAALAVAAGAGFFAGRSSATESEDERALRATPGVITVIRDVARLEATSFHVEKVVEATDRQSRLWGLFEAKDALLLVAVGDVVAGVDLEKLRDDDVHVDPATKAVAIRLPQPEILSATLDERATHVYSRATDTLAAYDKQLEGDARRAAEEQIRKAAIDGGVLDRARASAARTIGGLVRSLGYAQVDVGFREAS